MCAPPELDDSTDGQLLKRFRAGDLGAFETLFARYKAPLYSFVLFMTGSEYCASKIFQEIWRTVIEDAAGRGEPELFRIRLFRRAAVLTRGYLQDAPVGRTGPGSGTHRPDETQELCTAIHSLSWEQKEALLLRNFSGCTFAEIAAITGLPVKTLLARLSLAAGQLAARYAKAQEQAVVKGCLNHAIPR